MLFNINNQKMSNNKISKQKKYYKSFDLYDTDDFYFLDKKLNGKRMNDLAEYTQKVKKMFFDKRNKILFSTIEVENMKNEVFKFIKLLNFLETTLNNYINNCKDDIKDLDLERLFFLITILESSKIIDKKFI